MKRSSFWHVAFALTAALASAQGCRLKSEATPDGSMICTPGNYVFCRCADRAEGTKLCKEDGKTFEACMTKATGECEEDPTEEIPDEIPTQAAVESCPGKPTAVGSTLVTLEGSTTGSKDRAKGKAECSVGAGGADHVYLIQPSATGTLTAKVQGAGGFNPTVYVRTNCDDESSQLACAEESAENGTETLRTSVVAGKDYHLFVDGAEGTSGPYKVTLELTNGAGCGDKKVDTNEACDDGNQTDGDGCSKDCKAVDGNPTVAADCTGHPVHVWPGQSVSGTGSTVSYSNNWTKTTSFCDVSTENLNAAPEHIYEVTAHASGMLKVTLTPSDAKFLSMVVARAMCLDPNSQSDKMCNRQSAGLPAVITFPVSNGQKVYVAAEGALTSKGEYTIKFELP